MSKRCDGRSDLQMDVQTATLTVFETVLVAYARFSMRFEVYNYVIGYLEYYRLHCSEHDQKEDPANDSPDRNTEVLVCYFSSQYKETNIQIIYIKNECISPNTVRQTNLTYNTEHRKTPGAKIYSTDYTPRQLYINTFFSTLHLLDTPRSSPVSQHQVSARVHA